MTRYNYNRQLDPPAPFVFASIKRPGSESDPSELPAQLDTAADLTVIPASLVESLGLHKLDEMQVMGFGGRVSTEPTFVVELTIRGLSPAVIEVLGNRDEPFVLLGRDVLNRHRIVLDGPNLLLELS